jgi:hypothetical protein
MGTVLEAASEIQDFLLQAGERFCVIGAVALQRWGEQRATRDVDLTLLCPFGQEGAALDRLLGRFAARLPDARDFALKNRVVLLKSSGGVAIDVSLGGLPFEERCVERSSDWRLGGVVLRTCSAEDLVVLKAFAARPRDWLDVESVIVRQGAKLDWPLVFRELEPLVALREAPEIVARLRELQRTVN